ncbi:MAG: FG-GAP-like repeat-containing protein [Bacteroidia bacterium]
MKKIPFLTALILFVQLCFAQVPTISGFTPLSAYVNDTVTISGTNFSSIAANNTVRIGRIRATIVSATTTQIKAIVPYGAVNERIFVTVSGQTSISVANFLQKHLRCSDTLLTSSLSSAVAFASGTNPQNIKAADIDGDGKSDLLLGNMTSSTLSVLRNTSTNGVINSSTFASKVDITTGASSRLISIVDFDGDGKLDVAVPSYNANMVSILRNTSTPGTISFATKVDFSLPGQGFNSAVADFNLDGKPDLVVTTIFASKITVFPNTSTIGAISFGTSFDFTTGATVTSVDAGDINFDGKPEIFVANAGSNTISVYRNVHTTGSLISTSFAAKFDISVTNPVAVKAVDFDGDGKLDIGVTNGAGPHYFSVLRNLYTTGAFNASSFATKVDVATGAGPQFFSTGDINGDGKVDIVTPNSQADNLSLIRNKSVPGTLLFSAHVLFSTGQLPTGSEIVDIDNDAMPDVAICSQNSSQATVFRNISPAPPAINLGADSTFCGGFSKTLNANNSGSTYLWSTTAATQTINTAIPGTYWVKVTNPVGCMAYDTITLNQINISVNTGTDKTIMLGDSVVLNTTASNATSYLWSPSTGLSDSTLLSPWAKPVINTRYVIKASNGNCFKYDTVMVYVSSNICSDCNSVYPVNDSLVLCYLFNGDANDLSGNGNHGNLFGATLSTDRFGNTGGAYSFNGSSQYIEVPNSASISSPVARLTTVFWVQVTGWSTQFGVNYASILSKSNSTTNCQYRVSLKDNGVSVINNGKLWDFNGTGISLNTWYHIAVVFNNNNSSYYVNGVYAGQSTSPGTFASNSGSSMYIGRDDPGTIDYFGGKVDELRVFARALSAAEIMQLYSRSFTQFANAGTDTSVCAGDSIRLTASGGVTHAWYPQQGLSDTTGQTPFVKPNQNRTYVLKAIRGACTDLDTVSVTYIPVGVNAGSDTSICPGKSVQLNATGTGVIGWRTSSALNDSTVFNPIALPLTTTNFIAKSSNAYCRRYDTVSVTVKSPQSVDAGATQIICLGDTVQLAATAGLSAYRWTPSNAMNDSTIYNPKAFPSTATIFTVYATESQGCEVSDTVTVLVTSGITGNITNADTVVCSGAAIQLWATGGSKYTWTPTGGLSSPLIHNPIATVSSTVRYKVEVSNGGSCKGYDSVLITVNPAPEVKVNDTAFCEGGKAFLYATPLAAGTYQYEWSTSDTSSSVNVSPQVTKEYYVRVKSAGCYSLMDTASVTIWPVPLAKFAATPDKGFPPHKVYIQNQSIGAVNYFWNFGDNAGITGRSFDTNYVYSDTGTYRIRLIAESNFGCKDTAWKFVKVSDSLSIYIPNIFTPNEDGTNDTWEVTLIGVSDYSVMIFNRWGEKLFEQDYTSGTNVVSWNGRYRGSDVADGVYFFILNYTVRGVGRNERAGPIHIVR